MLFYYLHEEILTQLLFMFVYTNNQINNYFIICFFAELHY